MEIFLIYPEFFKIIFLDNPNLYLLLRNEYSFIFIDNNL